MQERKTLKLIQQAQNGNPMAFEQLIRMFNADMYRVASAILMNDEDTADAIQDTILACWEHLSSLISPQFFKTWLIRILINNCYRILKTRTGKTSLDEIPETGREDVYNVEFMEALSTLKDQYRLPAVLYYCEGYGSKEIAQMLKIPDATVRTWLRRAREILREYYEDGK